MSLLGIFVSLLALGIIISSVLLIKESATKFNLTDEQLKKIKARNEELDKEDDKEE